MSDVANDPKPTLAKDSYAAQLPRERRQPKAVRYTLGTLCQDPP